MEMRIWLLGRNRGPGGRQRSRGLRVIHVSMIISFEIQSAIIVKQAWRPREVIPMVDEPVTGRTVALCPGLKV